MKINFEKSLAVLLLAGLSTSVCAGDKDDIQRGRYLTAIAGCNDCHTPGYMEKNAKVAEAEWLTGSNVGWMGPWGTTYPSNLRLLINGMTEKQWLEHAKKSFHPPMPSWALHEMSKADLKAFYRYVRSLGTKGVVAPAYVPPGGKVNTPYMDLTVRNLPVTSGKK